MKLSDFLRHTDHPTFAERVHQFLQHNLAGDGLLGLDDAERMQERAVLRKWASEFGLSQQVHVRDGKASPIEGHGLPLGVQKDQEYVSGELRLGTPPDNGRNATAPRASSSWRS